MGEAYNALLNHIHLYPIINFNYAAKNKTPADATGATLLEKMRNTIKAALIPWLHRIKTPTPKLPGDRIILLAHSSRRWDIEESLQRCRLVEPSTRL
jgi:hypothetical protein